MHKKQQGFTLIELMIVVAIIAVIAAIAVPNLLSAKLAANESNAISTLRNLVSAQAQFQSIAAVDADDDGTGEYGCFGEMSGIIDLNARGGGGPAAPLNPPILASTFQNTDGDGLVTKSGYFFRIYLPDGGALGVAEVGGGLGAAAPPAGVDDDNCEVFWSAYAWPVDAGTTGNRTFFVNQRGEIVQTKMDALTYSGDVAGAAFPAWNAALDAAGAGGDMGDALGINAAAAVDGNTWTPVQ